MWKIHMGITIKTRKISVQKKETQKRFSLCFCDWFFPLPLVPKSVSRHEEEDQDMKEEEEEVRVIVHSKYVSSMFFRAYT